MKEVEITRGSFWVEKEETHWWKFQGEKQIHRGQAEELEPAKKTEKEWLVKIEGILERVVPLTPIEEKVSQSS